MWHALRGAAQRRWWKHYSLNSLKTPQGTPGVHPQTCARDKLGPFQPSCFSDSQVFWTLIPSASMSRRSETMEKCMWGGMMGQVWKDTLQVPLMQQQRGPVTTERLGSPLPRGENSWSYQQQWVLISIYLVFRYLLTLYHTPSSVRTAAWDLTEQHLGLGETESTAQKTCWEVPAIPGERRKETSSGSS